MIYFKVFSIHVANKLSNMGFEVLGHEINLKMPTKKVFLFENTNELRQAFEKAKTEHMLEKK